MPCHYQRCGVEARFHNYPGRTHKIDSNESSCVLCGTESGTQSIAFPTNDWENDTRVSRST